MWLDSDETDATFDYEQGVLRPLFVQSRRSEVSSLSDSLRFGADYMNIVQLKHAVRRLSLAQLRKLDEWLRELIGRVEEAECAKKSSSRKRAAAGQTVDDRTYRLESIRCGKEKCKCARGKLHGPYWYSYSRVKDKVTSQYIGKKLPKDIEKKLKYQNDKRS
jgi:hypothetical protein